MAGISRQQRPLTVARNQGNYPRPMLIGLLQCDEVRKSMREQFDDYPAMFYQLLGQQDAQLEFKTYRVIDEVFPQNPTDCDAYLITGSRAGVYEDHAWIEPATALIGQLFDAHKPVVGICFGHQLLDHSVGASKNRTRAGVWVCTAGKYKTSPGGWVIPAGHFPCWSAIRTRWWNFLPEHGASPAVIFVVSLRSRLANTRWVFRGTWSSTRSFRACC